MFSPLEGAQHLYICTNAFHRSSSPLAALVFAETEQEPCWDFLLSDQNQESEENASRKMEDTDKDCLLFEFSSEPLLPCYHVQVSVTQG